jgi:hypothetical protein
MTQKENEVKACFNCQHRHPCAVKYALKEFGRIAGHVTGDLRITSKIGDVIADNCVMYEKMEHDMEHDAESSIEMREREAIEDRLAGGM